MTHRMMTYLRSACQKRQTCAAGLFRLATDPSLGVRRAVCAGLVHMLQLQPGLLAPQMRDVIQYMLESTQVREGPCCGHWPCQRLNRG